MTGNITRVLLFGGLAAALAWGCGGGTSPSPGTTTTTTATTTSSTTTTTVANNTITITSAGVSPNPLRVALGSQVTFVNNDSVAHDMQSDPHPEHTDCPALAQVGFLSPGQSRAS